MGKLSLLLVGAFILASATILHGGMSQGSLFATERLGEYGSQLVAREIAHTGMGDALNALSLDYGQNGSYSGALAWAGNYQGGSYEIEITITGSTITVISTGTHGNTEYIVRRVFEVSANTGTPPFMAASLTSDGNLIMDQDITIVSADPTSNASVHSNGNINIQSGTALVEGFGHYVGNVNITNGQVATDIFQPNSNPVSSPITEQVDEIDVPIFVASDHLPLATWSSGGNLDLSGNQALGTEENPTIWYVDGNVTTSGNVSFSGYGVIIATGNIEIDHDVTLVGGGSESTLGFYTNGNIILNQGNLNVAGQWYSNGNIRLEDQTNFTGTMTTDGNFEFFGQLNVNYRPPSSALTEPFWPSSGLGLAMSTTREWAVE